ncbi:zinc-ribbon domain-containing protein [Fictibacillus aquaticus]|uniref:Zinc-ribbon domain-containing protein n=1 Tax=Fictibacillus aquaticus TaxID=2021314 RepID=A0A235F667_9BACL|nr:zinc-ribbon domain-containing protein [Fictibacillus aquaticus]OYD56709.1 hypothetical protein CGZ90_17015 [Fictibacillus aquaticus]
MVHCKSCGKEVPESARFCSHCGAERTITEEHGTQQSEQQVITDTPRNDYPSSKEKAVTIFKKVPWYGWIAAILLIGFLVNSMMVNSPKDVVEAFFDAMEDKDMEEAGKYVHPSIPWDENNDAEDIPDNAEIDILAIEEEIDGNRAEVNVKLEMTPKPIYGSGRDETTIELKKVDGDWLIVDMD